MSEDSERAAIVAWLRADQAKVIARASNAHPAQINRIAGHAMMLGFIAKQIEDGSHHMAECEYARQFTERMERTRAEVRRGVRPLGGRFEL